MQMTSEHYSLIDSGVKDHWSIMIREGEYEGVIYTYNKIGLSPDGVLSYTFDINDSCDFDVDVLKYNEEFNTHIGDILVHILEDSLENNAFTHKDDNRNTETRT